MTKNTKDKNLASLLSNDEMEALYSISLVIAETNDFDEAFEQIFKIARQMFIFDNIVIYQKTTDENCEPVFARALGRGKSTAADLNWGNIAATSVMKSGDRYFSESAISPHFDRLDQPFVLGIPILARGETNGVLVFIRFGGPEYLEERVVLAEIFASHISHFFERQFLIENLANLEASRKLIELQETFVAMITHDLNTPIGFIKGYTTTLLRQDVEWDEETQNEFLQIIDEETDRLSELINTLLDSSRLQTGTLPMEFNKIDIGKFVESLVKRLTIHIEDIKIMPIIRDTNIFVNVDSTRLSSVFENLIGNASKYAPDCNLKIKVEKNNESAIVTFEDDGPGIPEQYFDKIFNKFFRVPDKTSGIRGSGLGLYICKQIIEAHKGTISVSSNIDKGTKFIIELPLYEEEQKRTT